MIYTSISQITVYINMLFLLYVVNYMFIWVVLVVAIGHVLPILLDLVCVPSSTIGLFFPTLRGISILGMLMKRPSWSCFRDTTRACQVLHSSPAVRDRDRGHIYPGLFLPGHHSLTDICQTSDHYPGSHYGKHIPQSFHGETSRHLTSRK